MFLNKMWNPTHPLNVVVSNQETKLLKDAYYINFQLRVRLK